MGMPSLQRLLLAIVWEPSDLLHPHGLREVRDGDRGPRPQWAQARDEAGGQAGVGVRWGEGRKNYVNFGASQRWLESRLPCPVAEAPPPQPLPPLPCPIHRGCLEWVCSRWHTTPHWGLSRKENSLDKNLHVEHLGGSVG